MTLTKHFPNTNAAEAKKVPIEGTPCVHQQNLIAYLHNYDMMIIPQFPEGDPEPKVQCHCYKCDNTVVMLLSGPNIVAMHG